MKFKQHLIDLFKRYALAFILGSILGLLLLILGIAENSFDKVCGYLFTMIGCFLLSEFFYFSGQPQLVDWKIKHPSNELLVVIASQVIVIGVLCYWFLVIDQQTASRWVKMLTMLLRILFVFPVFFLIYFLAIKKYTLKELGILRFNFWYVSLPLIVLIGGVAYLIFPDGLQFQEVLKTNGYLALITLGFLTASIPEEITRMLLQTRLYGLLKNKSFAWFSASFIWALFHIPVFTFNGSSYYEACISALGILPLGLLWGYLNERYRSILPSVIIHGTNLWGLQNIF